MRTVTYSKNVFLPITNACRNACTYCSFHSDNPSIMSREDVQSVLESGKTVDCREALFTFGERPDGDAGIKKTLHEWGYASMTEYLIDLCSDAIEKGLLPHTNAGALEYGEMKALAKVNASMGLMLENASERLFECGMPHENSPGKRPDMRLETIENAGKLKIPFTTGLLIGIGETQEEVLYSIDRLKRINDRYGHIQEVIVQNFLPKAGTPMAGYPKPGAEQMIDAVRAVRIAMPGVHIQVPPNLNRESWPRFVKEGVSDIGGISPATKDYINPEADWPDMRELESLAMENGIILKERLAIYSKFIKMGWYSKEIGELIRRYTGLEGLANEP